jgi:outer membrane protein TolC
VGVSVPLLQNMVIDKRRAALQQAKIFVDFSEVERMSVVNNLLRDALHAYWEWWEEYHLLQLVDSSLKNARERFVLVKTAYRLGDRPAIDTVEALTQVQAFEVSRADIYTRLVKAQLDLSTYLWRDNNEPYDLPATAVPQSDSKTAPLLLETLLTRAMDHPDLRQYTFKLASLQIERRLKFQSLLPAVDLKYNQMGKGYNLLQTAKAPLFQNNYRFGASIAVPLRLSAGRGSYQQAKLKIEQTTLDQANKQVQIQAKVKQYFTEWQQTTNQLIIQGSAVTNYATLQRGEEIRFSNGESSLFFINAREQKTLEARQKWVELQAKNRKALANVRWSAGVITE